jgi:hypothetical protein
MCHIEGDLPSGVSCPFSASPPQPFECCGNAALISGADPEKLDMQALPRDLQDGGVFFPLRKSWIFSSHASGS